ncbi:MAG TPA: type II toxin-antitoxin system death-on-curing family toxin [Kiritimatiellia bacterium]|nr:type II toxin-antitoxin system death-on-curing family toxin [Kiritimatiellia bacterium]
MADCIALHEKMVARFGGLPGIRDEGLLESAVYRAKQLFAYGAPSLFDMAAAYASGIIRNHPFLDGNKRAGLVAAGLFIELNGYQLECPEEEALLNTLALAAGEMEEEAYGKWLENACRPRNALD